MKIFPVITFFLWLAVMALAAEIVTAQESAVPSTPVQQATDTLTTDSLRADSLTADTVKKKSDDADTLVNYTAAEIDFDVIRRVSVLTGAAVITYKDMRLEAERIEVDWDRQVLTATGSPDTLYKDSLQTEIDTIVAKGRPHFLQGKDDFFGDEITYNLKTKVGRVRGGTTTYEDGYYYGKQFKRVADDVITVAGGNFTTCDADTPHYHFAAKELKVMVGERVIARPVILCFEDVPVMAAPYGVFPQQRGRTSGILIPTFGESASQGRSLRDLGYYWAISDYMDARASMDYYELFGILGRGNFRYTKRYTLNGGVDFDFNTQRQGSTRRRDFSVAASHNQVVDPYTRLSMSGRYVSNRSFNQSVGTVEDQLNQSVQSNATLSRSFEYLPWTMNVNVGYTQNLKLNTWSATLPAWSFTRKTMQVFPPPKPKRGIRAATVPKELEPPWYRAFTWSYSVVYRNESALPHQRKKEGVRPGLIGLNGQPQSATDILGSDTMSIWQKDGLIHTAGLSANARLFKYFNLNPRLNVGSFWTRHVLDYQVQDKLLDRVDEHGFFQRTTLDLGGSINTKLYGVATKPLGIGASFRHVMTPTVGFTYRPDFSKNMWGYYETVTMPDGRTYTWDRFPSEDNISGAGATPKGISERFGLKLDHLFQMKTGEAEEDKENKYDLLSWTMNTAVDLRKDSVKWDNLGMSWRTSIPGALIGPVNGLAFDVTTSHSLYQRRQDGRSVNRFFWERKNGKWYAPVELLNAALNVGFSINAESLGSLVGIRDGAAPAETDSTPATIPMAVDTAGMANLRRNPPPSPPKKLSSQEPSQLFQMPLTINMNFRRNLDYSGDQVQKTSGFGARATFSLTPNWDVNFDYTFDLERREVRNVGVFVTRDLHCWEATFQWSPLGYRPGYFLRIGLKSPQLRDVKMERRHGAGFGGYY